MNTITVEVPEDKEAVWKDDVLTLVDKEATRTGYSRCRCAKFIKGDKGRRARRKNYDSALASGVKAALKLISKA